MLDCVKFWDTFIEKPKIGFEAEVWPLLWLNPLSDGIQIIAVLMGGALNAPPLKTLKMKLQSHVRGQNRGSWVCPVHLDYFQGVFHVYPRGIKLKISLIVTFDRIVTQR